MSTVLGVALIAATWLIAAILVTAIGSGPAAYLATRRVHVDRWTIARQALWWGLAITVIVVLAWNLLVPVSAPQVAVTLLLLAAASAIVAAAALRRSSADPQASSDHTRNPAAVAILVVLVMAQAYWAWAALGPVTNYDSGLYHLGAVRYAAEYSAIPGIANLYPAFGYATAQFPFAAIFTQLGWGIESFRLINGFMLALVACELFVRIRKRAWSPGTYFLLIMVTLAWVALIALSDYWVTSPSQDTSAWLLTSVAIAYVMDAVNPGLSNAQRPGTAATALALVTTLVMVRSTLAAFAVLTLAAVLWAARGQIRNNPRLWRPAIVLTAGIAAVGAAVLLLRDYVLSGWLFFPLDLLPTGAQWQAADPAQTSQAILGYHRDPSDIWGALDGWAWIPGWWTRAPSQWEFWAAAALWAGAVLVLVSQRIHVRHYLRPLVISAAPVAGATVIWFLATPPSPRFAWGLIFGLPALVLAWGLWGRRAEETVPETVQEPTQQAGDRSPLLYLSSAVIVAILGFSALFRADSTAERQEFAWAGLEPLTVALVPVPVAAVEERALASGLDVLIPTEGELCWTQFPLCSPNPAPALRPLGEDLADGLAADAPN